MSAKASVCTDSRDLDVLSFDGKQHERDRVSVDLAGFMTHWFDCLNIAGLEYAVMRNHEGLPRVKSGSDIDVLILPSDGARHLRMLEQAARRVGWSLIQSVQRTHLHVHKLAQIAPPPGKLPEMLHLDLFPGDAWYGAMLLDGRRAMSRSQTYGSIRILHPIDRAATIILHHLTWTGSIKKDKYWSEIEQVLNDFRGELCNELSLAVGRRLSNRLSASLKIKDQKSLRRVRSKLRATAVARSFSDNPLRALANWAQLLIQEAHQTIRPPGSLIGIISGDSESGRNLIKELVPWLGTIGRYNHGFLDPQLREIVTVGEESYAEGVRRAYGIEQSLQATTLGQRLNELCSARRRGRLILLNCSSAGEMDMVVTKHLDALIVMPDVPEGKQEPKITQLRRFQRAVVRAGDSSLSHAALSIVAFLAARSTGSNRNKHALRGACNLG